MTSSAVPPPHPLELCRFAVVDLETTGSAPPGGRVLEVAVAMLEGGTDHLAYHTLLDPGVSVPAAVVRLTGITDQLVAGRPRFADVAPGLARMLEDAIFVAHNARFDWRFLAVECAAAGVPAPQGPPCAPSGSPAASCPSCAIAGWSRWRRSSASRTRLAIAPSATRSRRRTSCAPCWAARRSGA